VGYMCFVRKLANKLIEMSKSNPEVNNCLDSIPEWAEYCKHDLLPVTMIESKPLSTDPRNRGASVGDDDLQFFFRLKS
jgi:hypothetical protein